MPNVDAGAATGIDPTIQELPEGWAVARLGDGLVRDIQPGFACGAHNRGGDGVPHLRPMNISREGRIELEDLNYVPADAASEADRWVEAGDVLFNNTNSPELVGKTALYDRPEPRAFSNHMTRLRVHEDVLDARYCAVALHTKWQEGYFQAACNNHVSQASVSRETLRDTVIPLPPLAEQSRIVERLDELSARVDAARDRLAKAPAILKRLRQAILAAACAGRLTEDWRKAHQGLHQEVEVTDKVLERHREAWERAELRRLGPSGAPPRSDRWKQRYSKPSVEPGVELPVLPEGWAWIPLGLLGEDPLNTVQTGPFGAQLHNTEFVDEGVPVIAVGNLTGMGFTTKNLYFITTEKAEQLERYNVHSGDLLFARSGATLGKVCVAPPFVDDWRMTGHILRARLHSESVP